MEDLSIVNLSQTQWTPVTSTLWCRRVTEPEIWVTSDDLSDTVIKEQRSHTL